MRGVSIPTRKLQYTIGSRGFIIETATRITSKQILHQLAIEIPLKSMFLIYWVGYFIDLVIPLERVGGDIVRVYLLQKQTNANYATLASSTVTFRLVSYFIVIAGLIIAGIVLILYQIPSFILTFFSLIFLTSIIYFGALFYLAYNKKAPEHIAKIYVKLRQLVERKKQKNNALESQTKNSLSTFYSGFTPFRHNFNALKKPLLYHALAYFLRIIVYVTIFYSLNIFFLPAAFFIAVFFVGSAVQDAIGSFSVGGLDILLVTLFVAFGLETGASGVSALLLRSADFWFPLIVATVIIQIIGLRNIVKHIPIQDLKKARKSNPSTQSSPYS
jgi:glycosyltransferase 2 family protein